MRVIINQVDQTNKSFSARFGQELMVFTLPNRLKKTFMPHLKPGVLVDFEVKREIKNVVHKTYYVNHFNYIRTLKHRRYKVIYDLSALRSKMQQVLSQYPYYLILDLEMTMQDYQAKDSVLEIIEAGLVLINASNEVIFEEGFYVRPEFRKINHRTRKFLKLDLDLFYSHAYPYEVFYQRLKDIIDQYQPQIITWGKNDLLALKKSYELHQKEPLIGDKGFTDLLKLHKDYFNLVDDLGLFKAYGTYYGSNHEQTHSALDDARVTKLVFDAFINEIKGK